MNKSKEACEILGFDLIQEKELVQEKELSDSGTRRNIKSSAFSRKYRNTGKYKTVYVKGRLYPDGKSRRWKRPVCGQSLRSQSLLRYR